MQQACLPNIRKQIIIESKWTATNFEFGPQDNATIALFGLVLMRVNLSLHLTD